MSQIFISGHVILSPLPMFKMNMDLLFKMNMDLLFLKVWPSKHLHQNHWACLLKIKDSPQQSPQQSTESESLGNGIQETVF